MDKVNDELLAVEQQILEDITSLEPPTIGLVTQLQEHIEAWGKLTGTDVGYADGDLGPSTTKDILNIFSRNDNKHHIANISEAYLPALFKHGGEAFKGAHNDATDIYKAAGQAPHDTTWTLLTNGEARTHGALLQDSLKRNGFFPENVGSNGNVTGPTTSTAMAKYINANPEIITQVQPRILHAILKHEDNFETSHGSARKELQSAIDELHNTAKRSPQFIKETWRAIEKAQTVSNGFDQSIQEAQIRMHALGIQTNGKNMPPSFDGEKGPNFKEALENFKKAFPEEKYFSNLEQSAPSCKDSFDEASALSSFSPNAAGANNLTNCQSPTPLRDFA